ncbi:MAG: universal stress protein [Deltaproteobacteria bacterium]|nr:universal stress protein [Deltaproteobacteria bacterium]
MFGCKRILVPSDFSECSERALLTALAFAIRFDSEVHLLHVTDRPGSKAYEANEATAEKMAALETDENALKQAYESAADRAEEETGLPGLKDKAVHFIVSGGDPAEEIVRVAEEVHADLIVLGTHGRTSVKDFFVGSTAERVVKRANCAVLAIKPEGYPYLRD